MGSTEPARHDARGYPTARLNRVWYVVRRGRIVQLAKVQGGVVREVGIGDARLTGNLARTRGFLRAWEIQ